MSVETLATANWTNTLRRMLARNGGIDLAARPMQGRPDVETFRSRLLEADAHTLLVERPAGGQMVRRLVTPGANIFLLLADGVERYELVCTVVGVERWQLNAAVTLPAVRLSQPEQITSAQRREHFRVSLAGLRLPNMWLTPRLSQVRLNSKGQPVLNVSTTGDPLPEPMPFEVQALNLSAGGIGLEAEHDALPLLKAYRDYCIRLELPTLEQPLVLNLELVHHCPQRRERGWVHYLGMRFTFTDDNQRHTVTREVQAFAAAVERRQLRCLMEKQA